MFENKGKKVCCIDQSMLTFGMLLYNCKEGASDVDIILSFVYLSLDLRLLNIVFKL